MSRQLAREWSTLSRPTQALLLGYALYVLGVWLFRVAPGEIAYERAQVTVPPGLLATMTAIHRAGDDALVVQLDGGSIAVLTPSSTTSDTLEDGLTEPTPAPGRVRTVVARPQSVDVLLTRGDITENDQTRTLVRLPADRGPAIITEVHPSALWPLPDGTAMGHGLTDFLTDDRFGLHPSGEPGLISGHLLLLRLADRAPGPDGMWATLPGSHRDDFLVLDADNAEPLESLSATNPTRLAAAPAIPGALVLDYGSYPSVIHCDDEGCRLDRLAIRTDSHPVERLDHCDAAGRIAACTPTELYLYAGDPLDEAIVFVGRAPLPAACTSLAILDQSRVLVTTAEGPRLVRFEGDSDG